MHQLVRYGSSSDGSEAKRAHGALLGWSNDVVVFHTEMMAGILQLPRVSCMLLLLLTVGSPNAVPHSSVLCVLTWMPGHSSLRIPVSDAE